VALEANAAQLTHDHSGPPGQFSTSKLKQENTHESNDKDQSADALHHTLGGGANQAAAGNHAHDYMGPSIFNKPISICTSTTRPQSPIQGQMIVETDTNCVRMWSQFSGGSYGSLTSGGNTLNYGISSTDEFSRTSVSSLGSGWSQTYYNSDSGSSPYTATTANGTLGTPTPGGEAKWTPGATNTASRCIARRVNSTDGTPFVTQTDDQVLTFVFGNKSMDPVGFWLKPPTNDVYLRMSSDLQSYVRVKVDSTSVNFYYTTSGLANETYLGGTRADTMGTAITWTIRAIGRTFIIYQGGAQIAAVTDSANVTNLGNIYRGWGIGMTAQAGFGQLFAAGTQATPASFASVQIADQPYYTNGLMWQLLPVGSTPVLRAEAHFQQQVIVGAPGLICAFDAIIEDWFHNPFMAANGAQTDIIIQEPGHYDVHASICWDPTKSNCSNTMVSVTVNGLDIGRKNWTSLAANLNQTNELYFHYYFAKGDKLQILARHNSPSPCFLLFNNNSPNSQTCSVEAIFRGP